mgnify:CR=1 FL=1
MSVSGRIRVEEGSGIKIGNSEVEVEKEINISGRMEIEKSEIKSEEGISKNKEEIIRIDGGKIAGGIYINEGKLEIRESEVEGKSYGIRLSKEGDIEIRGSKVGGETGIEIGENSEIEIGEGVEIKEMEELMPIL